MTHPVTSVRLYVAVFAALIFFTILTVLVSEVELGDWNILAAMTIAVIKGALVMWFFMHLRQAGSLTRLFAAAGLLWFAILISLTLSDYMTRTWLPHGQWW